jgi:hypothetical protein
MASAGAMDCSPPTSAAATGRQYILTAGTRLSYSLPAVLPNDATRHDSHRFGRALSDDTPTRAHLAHRVEIRRRIRNRQVRRLDAQSLANSRFEHGVERAGHEQRPFDRIRRPGVPEMVLNGVGERFEQVPVVPRAGVKPRRAGLRLALQPTSKVPSCGIRTEATISSKNRLRGYSVWPLALTR